MDIQQVTTTKYSILMGDGNAKDIRLTLRKVEQIKDILIAANSENEENIKTISLIVEKITAITRDAELSKNKKKYADNLAEALDGNTLATLMAQSREGFLKTIVSIPYKMMKKIVSTVLEESDEVIADMDVQEFNKVVTIVQCELSNTLKNALGLSSLLQRVGAEATAEVKKIGLS